MSFRYTIFGIVFFGLIAGVCFAESITIVDKIGGFRNTQACEVHGGVLYLLDYHYVITNDPVTGDFLDTLDLGEYVRNIDFSGDLAVVVGIAEAHLIDISDPTDMVELDAEDFSGSSGWDVDIEDDLVFLAVHDKLAIYRIAGGSLVYVGSYSPSTPMPMVRSVAAKDTTIYIGLEDIGIAALNVSAPSSPVLRMSADTPGHTLDLQLVGDMLVCSDGAFIGSDSASVQFFNIPTSTVISEAGAWKSPTGSDCRRSFVVGDRLALADGEGGVRAIDFSTPSSPVELAHIATRDDITDVCLLGDTLFATGTDTLYIMITDAFPTDTTTTFSPIQITGVEPVSGTITACDPIIDFSIAPGSYAIDIASIDIDALGMTFTGFDIEVSVTGTSIELDLSDYTFDEGDTIVATLEYVADIAGSTAVGIGASTSFFYDHFEPEFLAIEGGYGDWQHPDSVIISGTISGRGHANFVEDSFKISVNDISYSVAGMYLSYDAPNFTCEPMGLFHDGDTVDVCIRAADNVHAMLCGPNILDSCWRFLISSTGIDESPVRPDEIAISAYPNPFNSAVHISFCQAGTPDLPVGQASAPEIEIFDINGRTVAKIPVNNPVGSRPASTTGDAGVAPTNREYIWSPEKSVGSGVYLVRALVGDNNGLQPIVTKRMVYLK